MSTRSLAVRYLGFRAILPAILAAGLGLGGCVLPETGAIAPPRMQPVPPPAQVRRPVPPPAVPSAERSVLLGKSVRGEELRMWVLGQGADVTFILGGIHGDEPAGAEVARRFLDHLRAHPELWKGKCVAVLPRANPDGLAAGTRVNSRGVDVNRNFPASNWAAAGAAGTGNGGAGARGNGNGAARYNGGGKAGSEPESQALMQAVNTLNPKRIISLHAISGGRHCNNWDGPAEDLARRMAAKNGYPAKGSIGYPTPGSMGTWAGIDRKIPMITLELPDGASADDCWRANRDALLEAIR
jgi:protein MpaA